MDDYMRLREALGDEFAEVWRLQSKDIVGYLDLIDAHCKDPTKREFLLSVLSVFHTWYPPFGVVLMAPTSGGIDAGKFIEKHGREKKAMLKDKGVRFAERPTDEKYKMGLRFAFHMLLNPSFDIGVHTYGPDVVGYQFMSADAVIWCDGHLGTKGIVVVVEPDDLDEQKVDTHEGNAGSWIYNCNRDRLLIDGGWSVRKYHSREIEADAMECAEDLVHHMVSAALSFKPAPKSAATPSIPCGRAQSADHAQKCSKPN